MQPIRVETVVQEDGEVRLNDLPCRRGDRVEAVIWFPKSGDVAARQQARERFLTRAQTSQFRSAGAYPTRDELHDRH